MLVVQSQMKKKKSEAKPRTYILNLKKKERVSNTSKTLNVLSSTSQFQNHHWILNRSIKKHAKSSTMHYQNQQKLRIVKISKLYQKKSEIVKISKHTHNYKFVISTAVTTMFCTRLPTTSCCTSFRDRSALESEASSDDSPCKRQWWSTNSMA